MDKLLEGSSKHYVKTQTDFQIACCTATYVQLIYHTDVLLQCYAHPCLILGNRLGEIQIKVKNRASFEKFEISSIYHKAGIIFLLLVLKGYMFQIHLIRCSNFQRSNKIYVLSQEILILNQSSCY